MSLDETRAQVLELLEREAVAHHIDIVDVEVVGSAKSPTVRVRIDHADTESEPITLDEVSAETGWISDLLDDADPIEGAYTLEVSSPGLARPLRKVGDFARFAGERVALNTIATEGRRRYTGVLEGIDDGVVRVSTDEGTFEIAFDEIKSCKIKPDFNAKSGQRN